MKIKDLKRILKEYPTDTEIDILVQGEDEKGKNIRKERPMDIQDIMVSHYEGKVRIIIYPHFLDNYK